MPVRVPTPDEYALLSFEDKTQAIVDLRDLVDAYLQTEKGNA